MPVMNRQPEMFSDSMFGKLSESSNWLCSSKRPTTSTSIPTSWKLSENFRQLCYCQSNPELPTAEKNSNLDPEPFRMKPVGGSATFVFNFLLLEQCALKLGPFGDVRLIDISFFIFPCNPRVMLYYFASNCVIEFTCNWEGSVAWVWRTPMSGDTR